MPSASKFLLSAVLVCLGGRISYSQSGHGDVEGYVVLRTGEGVAGASVTFEDVLTDEEWNTTSGLSAEREAGFFAKSLPSAVYIG